MTKLESALALAEKGFYVFPVSGKIPAIKDWPNEATTDPVKITRWFKRAVHTNIGIATGKGAATIVIDVDVKSGKAGAASLEFLESTYGLLSTFRVQTPSGGQHLYFRGDEPVRNSVEKLLPGIDIRSAGGYVVSYGVPDHPVAAVPDWLLDECRRKAPKRPQDERSFPVTVHAPSARARAVAYLEQRAPAIQGSGGDMHTFATIAKLKDIGVNPEDVLELLEPWNERCSPPWDAADLEQKIKNAYAYGENAIGSAAPEADFGVVEVLDPVRSPLAQMNQEYALVQLGGGVKILSPEGELIDVSSFHTLHLNRRIMHNDKVIPLSRVWMNWPRRRTYTRVVFAPGSPSEAGVLNLWGGFPVPPADSSNHPAVAQFLEHVRENLCASDPEHANWALGWMAHLIQHPGVKPLVALVFRGDKGTGKSIVFNILGKLVGSKHHLISSHPNHLTTHFTSHFENKLLVQFEEIQWAGSREAEGVLKEYITGATMMIERKGLEPFPMANLMRIVLLSNADWIVPATAEERRFAVFDVGTGRQKDLKYFGRMKKSMESGGYAALMRYFLDYNLKGIDVDEAPDTQALTSQKGESLRPVEQWWRDCVAEGHIVCAPHLGDTWPEKLPTADALSAFTQYAKRQHISGWLPSGRKFGDLWRRASGITSKSRNINSGPRFYDLPPLAEAQELFADATGQQIVWED